MNKWLASVAFLLGIGVSASEAQFSPGPVLNPSIRSGTGPFFNPYLGGGSNPFLGSGFSPYLGGTYNPYSGPILGNAGGLQRGAVTGFGPGGGGLNTTGVGGSFGSTGVVTPLSSNITGHPTGFNSYSQYFNNQGGTFGTNVLTNPASQLNALSGPNARPNNTAGNRLPQAGNNILQP